MNGRELARVNNVIVCAPLGDDLLIQTGYFDNVECRKTLPYHHRLTGSKEPTKQITIL